MGSVYSRAGGAERIVNVAVLGGGNGSHAAVVEMARKGFEVRWWRREARAFARGGRIRHWGALGEGEVRPAVATGDLGAAVKGADLVLAPLPATAQPELIARLAPLLESGQTVAFTPGTFGTWLGARARPDATFLECGTLPYLARRIGPDEVGIPVLAARLPTGSIPGEGQRADHAHAVFARAYPAAVRVSDGLDAALTNWGPVIHPPLVVHNLGAIESLAARFDIHAEGTSPSVKRTILALDAERIGLRRALGLPGEDWPIRSHYDRSPASMYPPDAAERLVASNLWRESLSLDHRYVQEDVLCGLVLTASLGRLAGCSMPVSEAIVQLVGVALGIDPWQVGRTAAAIGANDLADVRRLARRGFD